MLKLPPMMPDRTEIPSLSGYLIFILTTPPSPGPYRSEAGPLKTSMADIPDTSRSSKDVDPSPPVTGISSRYVLMRFDP